MTLGFDGRVTGFVLPVAMGTASKLALQLALQQGLQPHALSYVQSDLSITPSEDERPHVSEQWQIGLFGSWQAEKPSEVSLVVQRDDGQYFRVVSFAVRQLWPFDTHVGAIGTLNDGGATNRFWVLNGTGRPISKSEEKRALRALELIDERLDRHRKDTMAPEELLGRLGEALALARKNAANWRSDSVALKYMPLSRSPIRRYMNRYGWSRWTDLVDQLAPKQVNKGYETAPSTK